MTALDSNHCIEPIPGEGDNIASTKGLATGRVGLLGAVVIGISCIAPTYTLTSGLGPTISAVGAYVPAVLLLGFIPMLLVAFAYRELNNAVPDSGTSFTWATKAFGPWAGWMGGWGLIIATILVLSNLAAVAVDFFYLLLGQIFNSPAISALTHDLAINIPTTIVFIIIAGVVSYRGLESAQNLQYLLVALQIFALVFFDIVALYRAYNNGGFDFTPVEWSWFNPAGIGSLTMIAGGISTSIFLFWGWDVTLTMNEETKDPEKTPGRAATVTVTIIILLYIFTALAVIAWAGTGDQGLGAGNPDNQESIFAALSEPVLGKASILIYIAVLSSSFASLQSTMVGPARTLLAMGYYKALPPVFSKISPRFRTPSTATIVSAAAAAGFYVITRLISENALWDTISTMGLMVCFYYGITAVACIWYFRRELFTSVHNIIYKFVFPLIGGGFLLAMFCITAYDSMDPEFGSGSEIGGIGMVFIWSVVILALGVLIMAFTRVFHPDFFQGKTLKRITAGEDHQMPLV